MSLATDDRLAVKVEEAARLLDLHPKDVYKLIDKGVLPVVRIPNRRVRIPLDGLRQWLEQNTVGGRPNRQLQAPGQALGV